MPEPRLATHGDAPPHAQTGVGHAGEVHESEGPAGLTREQIESVRDYCDAYRRHGTVALARMLAADVPALLAAHDAAEARLGEVERERDEARRTAEQRKESNAHNYALREAAEARAAALAKGVQDLVTRLEARRDVFVANRAHETNARERHAYDNLISETDRHIGWASALLAPPQAAAGPGADARADALAGLLATARDHWHEDDARLGPCDLCRAVARVDAAGPADGHR